jgi:hypothetical protein
MLGAIEGVIPNPAQFSRVRDLERELHERGSDFSQTWTLVYFPSIPPGS